MIEGKFKLDLQGFEYVRGSLQNKVLRIALNKASSPVKASVQSHTPRGRDFLRQSMIIKVKHYRSGNVWVAVIGPSAKFSRVIGRGKGRITPSHYARYVERGTKYRKPTPYLAPALAEHHAAFMDTLTNSIRDQLATITKNVKA